MYRKIALLSFLVISMKSFAWWQVTIYGNNQQLITAWIPRDIVEHTHAMQTGAQAISYINSEALQPALRAPIFE